MRAYSEDLRRRVVDRVEQGKRPEEVAETFQISSASVRRFVQQKREQEHLHSQLPPGRPRILTSEHEAVLLTQIEEHKDATLAEHAEMLGEATSHWVSLMTIQRTLSRLGITRKKDASAKRA